MDQPEKQTWGEEAVPAVRKHELPERSTWRRTLLWLVTALLLFLIGRHFAYRSVDFIVYHQAARSLLAGRTDLYSDTFAGPPPMLYVYPPLFLLLISPLGWLSFANAFGIWFALMGLATAAVIKRACRTWRPPRKSNYVWALVTLAAPYVVYALRTGNAHLFVVLLVIFAVVAWSEEKIWTASFGLAFAGVIKLFPLFLLPFLVLRREWLLALRSIGFTCLLSLLPALYFGPQRTVGLYRAWYDAVVSDVRRFQNLHQLDHSLAGATERWLTRVDYSERLDPNYPQANFAELSAGAARAVSRTLAIIVLGLSLWLCYLLRERPREFPPGSAADRTLRIAATASLFVSAQLLLGPYTIVLYLCGWLLIALALPMVLQHCDDCMNRLLLGVGIANLAILAVPGGANQRALQAYGAFTLLGFCLWILSLIAGWKLWRMKAPRNKTCQ